MEPSHAKFCHPYEPYDIQLEFMRNLYACIENGNVGIFESPTGTGKSLSLICAALTWLRDNTRRDIDQLAGASKADLGDWLAQADVDIGRKELLRERQELEEKLAKLRARDRQDQRPQRPRRDGARPSKRPRLDHVAHADADDGDEFLLDDYDSDAQDGTHAASTDTGLSATTRALLDQLNPKAEEDDSISASGVKIIFCSRTHSQLTQFIHELRRVKPPSSFDDPSDNHNRNGNRFEESVKHLPLSSRKNLCINEKVLKLSSTAAINERCLELQKPGTPKDHKCPYLPTKKDGEAVASFRDLALARVRDIEDIAFLGKEAQICPYYASRSAVAPSEVLTLPYPLLLQKSARDALGLSVKDNVVIVDEAHNLMDAIADTLSTTLRLGQLQLATRQVLAYVHKFKNKLQGKNRVYVSQVVRLLNSITDCLDRLSANLKSGEIEVTASQLMSGKGVDQIRPHKLAQYIHESKLAYKVEGYLQSQASDQNNHRNKGVLTHFQTFLIILMNPASEGRFFISKQDGDIVLRYILLDPREHFRDIVQDARAVILAGGTMSPMTDYANYLFSYLPEDRLRTFSFGHVIPKENIYVQAVGRGSTGQPLKFTFDQRSNNATIQELGKTLVRVCQTVPDGVVAFFPSYDYLAQVVQAWKQSSVLTSLLQSKAIFEESKGASVDDLLRDYTEAIGAGNGALMLSVVGGKLSEGINFSDRLGRAVVAVGLPFPNVNSGEWRAKIEHVEALKAKELAGQQALSVKECQNQARAAGRDFYENACMRAVNQSIGRAIRHREDYAAILLVDTSIPHPEPVSSRVYHIAGLLVTVYGLEELPPSCTDVAVLWLLHPRLQEQACMAPFAAHIIASWNTHIQSQSPSASPANSKRHDDNNKRGLIAASFDQRNHGSREVSPLANEAWRGGNETHAQDMFSCFQGTSADTSQLIDYLPGYVFPDSVGERPRRHVGPHIVLGVSLGGHSAWQCVLHDPRVTAAIVTIGCPDYERLMTDRARLSKRKAWLEGNGAHFISSADFPPSLADSVRRWDPAGIVFGTLRDAGRLKGQEHLLPHTQRETAALQPVMARCFGNKRILCLSGGADRLVPYKQAEPFMQWLKAASGKGGFFENGGLYLHDVVLPGVGHDVPPKMVEYMIRFVIDTLEEAAANKDDDGGKRTGGAKHARI
ncbi:hypothetical protein DV736_g824, partial [Chaetothyriales sp. CBS 134916]